MIWTVTSLMAGYALGRARLFGRLADWAEDQVRFYLGRWDTAIDRTFIFSLFAMTHPVRAVNAVRGSRRGE